MFGQGGNTFGNQNTTFGQSAFGAAKPTGFGTTTFGATNTATPSLFGATQQQPTTNLFGGTGAATPFGQTPAPAFGTSTPATGFGGFGAAASTPAPGTSLFGGGSTSLFGATPQQPAASTGSLFGTTTNTFGNKPAFGGFGATGTGLFGQTSQPPPTAGIFGQPQQTTAAGGLFGAAPGTSAFGSTLGAQPGQNGTAVAKFKPVQATDTVSKNNTTQTVQVRHQVITCMSEYETKSFEELRLEDYQANRKGPGQGGSIFGAQPSTGLFGAPATSQPSTGGLFGQQKTLFGATSSAPPALGTTTSLFGQQPAQQQTSLFGTKTFGATTTTAATGFGFGSTTTSTAGGLFGNKPFGAAAPTPGLFGAPATTNAPGFGTTATGFGGFGTPAQTTSPFGKTGFGATSTASPFSFAPAASSAGSLFGTQAKSAFGTATSQPFAAVTTTTPSLFAPAASTAPFGAPTQTGFGGFGATASPFSKPASFGTPTGFGTTTNLFGTQQPPPAATATPFGGTPMFGSTAPSTGLFGQQPAAQPAVQAAAPPSSVLASQLMAMSQSTFSDNPVLRNIIEGPTRREDLLKPAMPPTTPTTRSGLPTYYRVSPRLTSAAKPVALTPTSKVGLFDGLEEDDHKPADDLLFKPRQSVKKLTLKPKTGTSRIMFDFSGAQSPAGELTNGEASPLPKETLLRRPPALDDTTTELIKRPPSVNKDRSMINDSVNVSMNGTVNETHMEPDVEPELENVPPHPLGIKCRRYGYYTIPSLEELAQFEPNADGAVVVENFVVGREGYGNISFKGPLNVVDLDIDKYVFILHKQVNVYPNDDEKPPVGQEFNRKSQVTLDRVWPLDKGAGVEIRDPKRLEEMRYREKLQHCSAKSGAFFKEYRPETGSWVFDVPHFSKYGLEEADEDEERENLEASPVAPESKKAAEVAPSVPTRLPLLPLSVVQTEDGVDARFGQRISTVPVHEARERFEENREVASPVVTSGPRQLLALVGAPVEKTQLNKLTIFGDDHEMEFGSAPMKKRKSVAPQGLFASRASSVAPSASFLDSSELDQSVDMKRTSFREILDRSINLHYKAKPDLSQQSFRDVRPGSALSKSFLPPEDFETPADYTKVEPGQAEPEKLRKIVPKFGFACPLGETSSLDVTSSVLCDKDIFNGKRGRVGWNNKMMFASPGVDNRNATLRLGASPYVASLKQVPVENLNPTKPSKPIGHLHLLSNFKSLSKINEFKPESGFYGKMLMAELEKSVITENESGPLHRFNPSHGTTLLESQLSALQSFLAETKELGFVTSDMAYINYIKEVLALCSALWGKLPEYIEAGSYAEQACRKKLVGDWLREYASLDTFPTGTSTVDFALADMTGERISSACERLVNAKDYNAAFAMSQVETYQAQQFTGSQLEQWTATGADRFIDRSRLRLHCQLARFSTYKSSSFSVNTCEMFTWRQAFAHHFWYVVPGTGTIADALNEFDLGCNEGYAARPAPAYLDLEYADRTRDLCYHLLQLYCYRKTLLEPLLNPASSTADPVEHTLSYLLLQLLHSLGYSHFTEHAEGTVLTSFAAQLEALDQWTWAVFIGLHIKNPADREAFVKGILARHVTVQTDTKSESEVSFLLERLLIPRSWIATAASYRAQSMGLHHLRAQCLVEAGLDIEAHRLIVDRLGPDAILGKRTQLVTRLLEDLSEPERCSTIFNWSDAGEIYLSYFRMVHAVDELLDSDFASAVEVEKLLPQVTSLCGRIADLATPTAKHKLVQSRMATRTAEALRSILKMQNGGQLPPLQILPRITQLPLPEDAAMEELQNVLRSYTLENAYDELLEGMEEQ